MYPDGFKLILGGSAINSSPTCHYLISFILFVLEEWTSEYSISIVVLYAPYGTGCECIVNGFPIIM